MGRLWWHCEQKQDKNMPNMYMRKNFNNRGSRTKDNLKNAMAAVKDSLMPVRRASLERRLKHNNDKKWKLGPDSLLGTSNEKRLVRHIKNMQKSGFALTRQDVRRLAYEFTNQLGFRHKFNPNTEMAGHVWLQSFLRRNPTITNRKSEGLSLPRSQSMNREVVKNILFDKPMNIFNMDKSGLQLNNRPDKVLAEQGSKSVSAITSSEKGETITLVACCNAEGTFLPPATIMKGKNIKKEFEDNLPPGSKLFMSPKSAYMNSQFCLSWLKEHFTPRKPEGKTLLLDGHTPHSTSVEMLEYAKENDIILLCFPSPWHPFLTAIR
ncbi:unnamed protein product [Acanthoscelides obtectus]|uniref:HTH CENPB-type domain-containing protein n=1 Tax=Acanthoscelides obtectus TaxID=200917 RepID=A0A9P0LHG8_ACAOB|nr:unnamed protein product [Acanthoscelides obtectus]CAK1686786.1 hypothetical protein AOBTE_LOCUS36068 [Acanthoscelides obtectus]